MANLPMAVYGLEVPAGDVAIPARPDIPAAFRITMAAIDPSAEPEESGTTKSTKPRATLKIIRQPLLSDFLGEDDSDDESDFDEDEMNALLAEEDSDLEDDEDDDDEEDDVVAGPSDPAKSKKARKAAAEAQIMKELESAMEVDEVPNGVNGKKAKGKGKSATAIVKAAVEDDAAEDDDDDDEDEDEEDDEDDLDDIDEPEEYVICTLDTEKIYQQPLDITIGEDERVWFKVSGTHTIYLTGNYVEPSDPEADPYDEDDMYGSDDEDEYDLTPDEDELDGDEDVSEEDELDDLADPRVMEITEDEEAEVPALVAPKKGKGKNKRAADDSADDAQTLDDLISKAQEVNGEAKLSKKQAKKLKNNAGQAVPAEKSAKDEPAAKSDKKVSFAEKLEQGPTPSPSAAGKDKSAATTAGKDKSATTSATGPRVVQGVTIDVKKVGEGNEAKKGDRVGMRYIGKLQKDGKVFDSNKKGKPFTFKLGSGEVIKGLDIGAAGLRVGGERRITIPGHLAYGSKAQPGIPSNSTLVFDIKCVELKG